MDFFITIRKIVDGLFSDVPGNTSFLEIPDDAELNPPQIQIAPDDWARDVIKAANLKMDATGVERGDVLVFVHGYNNDPPTVLRRHRILKTDLLRFGFDGVVVSFDWPSGNQALAYLRDRHNAKLTAFQLVSDCIERLARMQAMANCQLNVHVLAHSTGAYVIQEAFDDADDHAGIASINWTVSQLVFIAGDVAATSLAAGDADGESTYRHCVRFTNYSNPFDDVLQLSNVKRAGFEPRVGRIGLPSNVPAKAVNVNCGAYYQTSIQHRDPATIVGAKSHSWYFGDPVFSSDLAETLLGDVDRHAISTRQPLATGQFTLVAPQANIRAVPAAPILVQEQK